MDWKKWGLRVLMVIAVGVAADEKEGRAGVALAILLAGHMVSVAVRARGQDDPPR